MHIWSYLEADGQKSTTTPVKGLNVLNVTCIPPPTLRIKVRTIREKKIIADDIAPYKNCS